MHRDQSGHRGGIRTRASRPFLCVLLVALLASTGGLRRAADAQEPTQGRLSVRSPERLQALAAALRNSLPYIPGELLVRFNATADGFGRASALRLLNRAVTPANAVWIGDTLHLTDAGAGDMEAVAALLARQPEIDSATPNYLIPLSAIPNDPQYGAQWNLPAINVPQAWDINPTAGSGVTVAVIDSGITTTEGTYAIPLWTGAAFETFAVPFVPTPDFDHARILEGAEFTPWGGFEDASTGEPLLWDAVGHGTHVAGTIAQATDNALGTAGVSSGVTLLPIKACFGWWDFMIAFGVTGVTPPFPPQCDVAGIVAGLRFAADNGAAVVNLSLGGPVPVPGFADVLREVVGRGAFVAIAAGNEAEAGNPPAYPAAYAAQLAGAVSVGATTRGRTRARYSSFGPYVEISAPGGEIQDLADGRGIFQVVPDPGSLPDLSAFGIAIAPVHGQYPRFDRYVVAAYQGTSMAAPHVAGAAALLVSQGITDPAAIEAALVRSAVDLGPPGRDDEFGHGQVDVRGALFGMGLGR